MSEISVFSGAVFMLLFLTFVFSGIGEYSCSEQTKNFLQKPENIGQGGAVIPVVGGFVIDLGWVPFLNEIVLAVGNILGSVIWFFGVLQVPFSTCYTSLFGGLNFILIPIILIIVYFIIKILGPVIGSILQGIGNLIPGT